jgi:hypothetical protein
MKVLLLESNYSDPLIAQAQAEQSVCSDVPACYLCPLYLPCVFVCSPPPPPSRILSLLKAQAEHAVCAHARASALVCQL